MYNYIISQHEHTALLDSVSKAVSQANQRAGTNLTREGNYMKQVTMTTRLNNPGKRLASATTRITVTVKMIEFATAQVEED